MGCSRWPVRNGWARMLCGIVPAMCLLLFGGCQEITEPTFSPDPNRLSGSPSNLQAVPGRSVQTGPTLTVTNEYMDPIASPQAGVILYLPEGIPLTFCWEAQPATGGGEIEAYRYGWDVFDTGNPNQWDVGFTAYDGSIACSPSRSFGDAGFHFFIVEVIDNAGASTTIRIFIQFKWGPASFDVMPGSCKNQISVQRKGRIRTVIPGRIGLAVSEIDVPSLYLWIDGNIVEPVETLIRDITSPMINRPACDCPPKDRDGIEDLVIVFSAADVTRALGPVVHGEIRDLSIHGVLLDGHSFALSDCVSIVGNPPGGGDPALWSPDAVLVALQKGYNEKDFPRVSALFDEDFLFFFSEEEYQSGAVAYDRWDREHELAATAKLFNADAPAEAPVKRSMRDAFTAAESAAAISWGGIKAAFYEGLAGGRTTIGLLLVFAQGEDSWIAVSPPDPLEYPGEVWYEKAAMYYLAVQINGSYLITDILVPTSFVVRFSETKGYWQLVRWRDDL